MLRPFSLNVRSSSGRSQRISICPAATVGELKEKACEALDLSDNSDNIEMVDYPDCKDRSEEREMRLEDTDLKPDQELLLRLKVASNSIMEAAVPGEPEQEAVAVHQETAAGPASVEVDTTGIIAAPFKSNNATVSRKSSRVSSLSSKRSTCGSSFHKDSVVKADDRPQGLAGLSNLGNTCFMNSSLQCLSHSLPLMDYFLTLKYLTDLNRTNPLGLKGELAEAFAHLLHNLWMGGVQYVCPRGFKYSIGTFASQFSGYAQHDSQEFLGFMMDGLHEDLNRILKKPYVEEKDANGRSDAELAAEAWSNYKARNDSFFVDHFQGLYKSTLDCPKCEHASVKFDPFMYLSLPLPESRVRSLTITVVNMEGLLPAKKYSLEVANSGSTQDVIHILKQKLNCNAELDNHLILLAKIIRTNHGEEVEVYVNKKARVSDIVPGTPRMYGSTEFLVAYDFPSIPATTEESELDPVIVHHQRPRNLGSKHREFFGAAPLLLLLPKGEAEVPEEQVVEQRGDGYCKELMVSPVADLVSHINRALTPYQVAASASCPEAPPMSLQDGSADRDQDMDEGASQAGESNSGRGDDAAEGDSMQGNNNNTASAEASAGAGAPATPAEERPFIPIPIDMHPSGGQRGSSAAMASRQKVHVRRRGRTGHNTPMTKPIPADSSDDNEYGSVIRTGKGSDSDDSVTSKPVMPHGGAAHNRRGGRGEEDDGMEVSSAAAQKDVGSEEADVQAGKEAGPVTEEAELAEGGTIETMAVSHHPSNQAPATGPFDMFAVQNANLRAPSDTMGESSATAPAFKLLMAKPKGETTMYSAHDRTRMEESRHFTLDWPATPLARCPTMETIPTGGTPSQPAVSYDTESLNTPLEDESVAEAEAKRDSMRHGRKPVALTECVEAFLQPEQLAEEDTWYCPRCKMHVQARKKLDLWSLPEVLVVHLKRFSYTKYNRNKLDTFVDFPLSGLDLTQYVMRTQDVEPIYDCFAVSNHFGSLGGGHYTAFCQMEDSKWYCYDDSHVSEVDGESQVVSPAGYVLFYHRRADHTAKYPAGTVSAILEQRRVAMAAAAEARKGDSDSSSSSSSTSSSGRLDQPVGRSSVDMNDTGNSCREMVLVPGPGDEEAGEAVEASQPLSMQADAGGVTSRTDQESDQGMRAPSTTQWGSQDGPMDLPSGSGRDGAAGAPDSRLLGSSPPPRRGSPVGWQNNEERGVCTVDMLEAANRQLGGMPVYSNEEAAHYASGPLEDMYLDEGPPGEGAGDCSDVSALAARESQDDSMATSGSEDGQAWCDLVQPAQ